MIRYPPARLAALLKADNPVSAYANLVDAFKDRFAARESAAVLATLEDFGPIVHTSAMVCAVVDRLYVAYASEVLRHVFLGGPISLFMQAVLQSDMRGVAAHSNELDQINLGRIVATVHGYLPLDCCGSEDAYRSWSEGRRIRMAEVMARAG